MAPCCCISLKKGVKIIATFEILVSILLIMVLTLVMIDVSFGGDIGNSIETQLGIKREIQFWMFYICWLIVFMLLLVNITLYRGAKNKNYEGCRVWLTIYSGIFMMGYIWSVMSMNLFYSYWNSAAITVNAVMGIYKGYVLYVVYKFTQEIKTEKVAIIATAPAPLPSERDTIEKSEDDSKLREEPRYPSLPEAFSPELPLKYPPLGSCSTFTGYKLI